MNLFLRVVVSTHFQQKGDNSPTSFGHEMLSTQLSNINVPTLVTLNPCP
jgi:hypothetical protein